MSRYDQYDPESFERPRRHTRPRTKDRPAHAAVIVGSAVDGVLVENVATTAKTFPGFAEVWAGLF